MTSSDGAPPPAREIVASRSATRGRDPLDAPEAPRSVIRGSSVRTTGYVLAAAANALVLPFLFRYLGVVDSGRYATVLSLVTIMTGIVEVGLAGVSVRLFAVADHARRPMLMRQLVAMRIVLFGVAAVGVMTFAVTSGYDTALVVGVALAATGAFAENIGSAYGVWMSVNLRFGWQMATNVLRQFTTTALTAALIIAKAPLVLFFAVFLPGGLTQLFSSYWLTRRVIPHAPSFAGRSWLHVTASSLPYVAAMAVSVIYFRVPMIAMSLLASPQETGYFGVSFRIVETLMVLTGFVLSASLPLLSRTAVMDPARYAYGYRRVIEVSVLVGGGLAVVTATGAPLAITILAGPRFEESVGLLQLLSCVLLLKFVTTAIGFGLLASRRFGAVLIANLAAFGAAAGLSAVGIPSLGGSGAAIAAVGSECVVGVMYLWFLRRQLVVFRRALPACATILLAAGVGMATIALPGPTLLPLLIGPVVFVAAVLGAGTLPPEVIDAVPLLPRFASRRLGT